MAITRRELLRLLALGGGAGIVLFNTKGDRGSQPSEEYLEYLEHTRKRVIGLFGSETARYIAFSQDEFEKLDLLIHSPILTINNYGPSQTIVTAEDSNKTRLFSDIVRNLGATKRSEQNFKNARLSIYSALPETDVMFHPEVADAVYSWMFTTNTISPSIYPGIIDHHVLIGNFTSNPFLQTDERSASFAINEEGIRTVVSIVNIGADPIKFGPPDSTFVTELAQGILSRDRILQERIANSISVAYYYALGQ